MEPNLRNPYVGPRTFRREEAALFYGRERESRDLSRLIATERIVLFYAQSGAGKSSLIQARLIPWLEEEGFDILPMGRIGGHQQSGPVHNIYMYNLVTSLVKHELEPGAANSITLTEFIAGLRSGHLDAEGEMRRQVLIIDQFEELFSTHAEAWHKREDFFEQVARAIEDHRGLRVLLAMRQEFIGLLDPYVSLLPNKLRARYFMNPLERAAALLVVKKPVEDIRPFAPGVAEMLVDDLSRIQIFRPDGTFEFQPGQFVEPSQIQVVCYSLWERLSPEGDTITERDLQDVGDVNQSLGNFYAERVRQVAMKWNTPERKIRDWFERSLIAPGGVRNLVVQDATGSVGGLDSQIVRDLSDLVRSERRGGALFYELVHDRLVEPILENNRRWYEGNSGLLQRQASIWNAQNRSEGFLLTGQALEEIETWAKENPDELTDLEISYLNASRKYNAWNTALAKKPSHGALSATWDSLMAQVSSARRVRLLTIVIAGLILLTIVAFFIGFYLGQSIP